LALSVWSALRDACASVSDYRFSPPMNAPATSEEVYRCISLAKAYLPEVKNKVKKKMKNKVKAND
jgi:xanthine dehydrogenase large subunit